MTSSQSQQMTSGAKHTYSLSDMQRVKEERELKRSSLDQRHGHVMSLVALSVGLDTSEIEDSLMEGSQIESMTKFFEANGTRVLMFFYQSVTSKADTTAVEKLGGQLSHRKTQPKMKVFISDGSSTPLTGICVVFTRNNTSVAITNANIVEELSCTVIDARNGLLGAVENAVSTVLVPSLEKLSVKWNESDKDDEVSKTRSKMLHSLSSFAQTLARSQTSINSGFTLKECITCDFASIVSPHDYQRAANDPEALSSIEECVSDWIKQINEILVESQQIRRDEDDLGPRAELEFWRKRMVRFGFLIDQLGTQQVKVAIGVLHAGRSKIIKDWKAADCRVTDTMNEAKDNVKFLDILETLCSPLYDGNPAGMLELIPNLMYACRMIYTISHYYTTSDRMTYLLSKVTNQMILACKSHISNDGRDTIWTQPTDQLIAKIDRCIQLYGSYRAAYSATKRELDEEPGELKFNFSETLLFGKFEKLSRRFKKISEMFRTIDVYSRLRNCTAETGVLVVVRRLNRIVELMRAKTYDWLDQQQTQFEIDYEEFERQIEELHQTLLSIVDGHFKRIVSTQRSLRLAKSFENLNIEGLNVDDQYNLILAHYMSDLENVASVYQKSKANPDVARDLPPIAGRIAWVRQLSTRIEQPMGELGKHPSLMKSTEGKRAVHMYNSLLRVLVEYEMVYFQSWLNQIEAAKTGLTASLLVRNTSDGELYVNLDPQVLTLFKETNAMMRFGLKIPAVALLMCARQTDCMRLHDSITMSPSCAPTQRLDGQETIANEMFTLAVHLWYKINKETLFEVSKMLLLEVRRVRAKIAPHLQMMLQSHVDKMLFSFEPGIGTLNWLSTNIESYLDDARKALVELELIVDRTNALVASRIDASLKQIIGEQLCECPLSTETWPVDHFNSRTKSLCNTGAQAVRQRSQYVEVALNDLIEMLAQPLESELALLSENGDLENDFVKIKRRKLHQAILAQTLAVESLVHHFSGRHVDALIKLARNSLESLKKRLLASKGPNAQSSFFQTHVVMATSTLMIMPTVDELQVAINQAVQSIIGVFKTIPQWSSVSGVLASGRLPGTAATVPPTARETASLATILGDLSDRGSSEFTARSEAGGLIRDEERGIAMKTYFQKVCENKDVSKLVTTLSSLLNSHKKEVSHALNGFNKYSALWSVNRDAEIAEFMATEPKVTDFELKIAYYEELEEQFTIDLCSCNVGPIAILTDKLHGALSAETKSWRVSYGNQCNATYRARMKNIFSFISNVTQRLNRSVKDIDDVRSVILTLRELREREISIDMDIGPIEESYQILAKHGLETSRDEVERVDTLRYAWQVLQALGVETSSRLTDLEPHFRQRLIDDMKVFTVNCVMFCKYYDEHGPMAPDLTREEVTDQLLICQTDFDNLWSRYVVYTSSEELFGLPATMQPKLHKIRLELRRLQQFYVLDNDVRNTFRSYSDVTWSNVKIEEIRRQVDELNARFVKLPKAVRAWAAYAELKAKIDELFALLPLLELMLNKSMSLRHWKEIQQMTGHQFPGEDHQFTLLDVVDSAPQRFKEAIEDTCVSAIKEQQVEITLKRVIAEWEYPTFKLAPFKNRGELLLRGAETNHLLAMLDNSLTTLTSLLNSRYCRPFISNITVWVQKLTDSLALIDKWMAVQNYWIYLESVFGNADTIRQLPQETRRFTNVDKSWTRVMEHVRETPNVIQCCVGDDFLSHMLPHILEQLENCKKSLSGYLERKRVQFPRFFFVSDSTLLAILGSTSDLGAVQSHLWHIFNNVVSLKLDERKNDVILSVRSSEGEMLELNRPFKVEGGVETWLGLLLKATKDAMHSNVQSAVSIIDEYGFNLREFVQGYNAQVCQLGIQLIWTRDLTEMLKGASNDKKIVSRTSRQVLQVLSTLHEEITGDEPLSATARTKLETLCAMQIHHRDVFETLCRLKISSVHDFEWLKQVRCYYSNDTDKCLIKIANATFHFQNEYLGCTERLIVTPLTERCYVALAQAISMSYGCNMIGPTGAGKTETVRDLSRCLGKYFVVVSCTDQMSFRTIRHIVEGAARSGCWVCLDEFASISQSVLSVAANILSAVYWAKKAHKLSIDSTFVGTLAVNPEFQIFTTQSNASLWRHHVPENLKMLFRPVAMSVPDRLVIVRVKLATFGFFHSSLLAKKIDTVYRRLEQNLVMKTQTDLGLRNVLAVLRLLNSSKRHSRNIDEEFALVKRALSAINVSRVAHNHEAQLLYVINEVFSGISVGGVTPIHAGVEKSLSRAVNDVQLVSYEPWMQKVIQLYEAQVSHQGLLVVGPAASGKTKALQVVMKALSNSVADDGVSHVREVRINPAVIGSMTHLFGDNDNEGAFVSLWRRTLRIISPEEHAWLILDGPVISAQTERFNSILDENRNLLLANGDRLSMYANCRIVFETDVIAHVAPSTLSRCAVVCFNSYCMHWEPILQSWLKSRPPAEKGIISNIFASSFAELIAFAGQRLDFRMNLPDSFIIRQTLDILEALIPLRDQREVVAGRFHYERLYLFAITWSIGALLDDEGRGKLEEFIRSSLERLQLNLPSSANTSTIFDFRVEDQGPQTGNWTNWNKSLEEHAFKVDPRSAVGFVPTMDTLKKQYIISALARCGKAVLLCGGPGASKTSQLNNYLDNCKSIPGQVSRTVNFSASTSPAMFQRTIESFLEKRMGRTYGPRGDTTLTLFIDDVNMPEVDQRGVQPTCELLRQVMDSKGFFCKDKPGDFKVINGVQFLAAMRSSDACGVSNDISLRLKRHFNVFACNSHSDQTVLTIFLSKAHSYFNLQNTGFSASISSVTLKLVKVTLTVLEKTRDKILSASNVVLFQFNHLREMARIWQGIMSSTADAVSDVETLLVLWKHECVRVIADRLMTPDGSQWFTKKLERLCVKELGSQYAKDIEQSAHFVDFLRTTDVAAAMISAKIYEPVVSLEVIKEHLRVFQSSYNNQSPNTGKMDLAFADVTVTHLVRISRITRLPRGHALLLGDVGSGRRAVTRLAAFIAGHHFVEISNSRSYVLSNFLDDLKSACSVAGHRDKPVTLYVTEQSIKNDDFMEYINMNLLSQTVSGLFQRDVLAEILRDLGKELEKMHPDTTPSFHASLEFFESRIVKNLHIVLSFAPASEKLRRFVLRFPGVLAGCTVDCYQRWPRDALVSICEHLLCDVHVECVPHVWKQLGGCLASVYDGAVDSAISYRGQRLVGFSMNSYTSFINDYKSMYSRKATQLDEHSARLDEAITKLNDSYSCIADLNKDLFAKDQVLKVHNEEANGIYVKVREKEVQVEAVRNRVAKAKQKAQLVVDDIEAAKIALNEKLKLSHSLEEAGAVLDTITDESVEALGKVRKPPFRIGRITDCLMILFQRKLLPVQYDEHLEGILKPSWQQSQSILTSGNFLEMVALFPVDTLNEETIELLLPYMEVKVTDDGAEYRDIEFALTAWIKSILEFYMNNRTVTPLKESLTTNESKLATAIEKLNVQQTHLDAKLTQLDEIQAVYDECMQRRQVVFDDVEKFRKRVSDAEAVIKSLEVERSLYLDRIEDNNLRKSRLVGDMIINAAFLSFLGAFNKDYRTHLMGTWSNALKAWSIPHTPEYNVIDEFVDPIIVSQWHLDGLPFDEFLVESCVIATRSGRVSVVIDPERFGLKWILQQLSTTDFSITRCDHTNFRTSLETSMSHGVPLLVEDVCEDFDWSAVDHIIETNFTRKSTQIGQRDFADGFAMYMVTQLTHLKIPPEFSSRMLTVDFTMTNDGLENYLLHRSLSKCKPELEIHRLKVLQDVKSYRQKLKKLEENLLSRILSTAGYLVEDIDFPPYCKETKDTVAHANHKLKLARDQETKVNTTCRRYTPMAIRGRVLYSVLVEMARINRIYYTSLDQFTSLVLAAASRAEKSKVADHVNENVIALMTCDVCVYSIRGFYDVDKMVFLLLLSLRIDRQANRISQLEFETFVEGGSKVDMSEVPAKPNAWIPDHIWVNLSALNNIPRFAEILDKVACNENHWKTWYNNESPEKGPLPDGFDGRLNTFHRLLMLRSWFPEHAVTHVHQYVREALGEGFVIPDGVDMTTVWLESTNTSPILGLLAPGCDPSHEIEQLAEKNKIILRTISMGQGQEPHALQLLNQAMLNSEWVLLLNCHLSLDFAAEIPNVIASSATVHRTFRLWLTTEPDTKFPTSLLQVSTKYAYDAPRGLKAGLKRTYVGIFDDQLENSFAQFAQWHAMLYAVVFLHVVMRERRSFGSMGWNVVYDFDHSDLTSSVRCVQYHLDDVDPKKGVDWACIQYMLAEVHLGGRLEDLNDRELVNAFCKRWFVEDLLKHSFEFHPGFCVPRSTAVDDIVEFFDRLPGNDDPGSCLVLGLPSVAVSTYHGNTIKSVLDGLTGVLNVGRSEDSSRSMSKEVFTLYHSLVTSKLPRDFVTSEVRTQLQKLGAIQPLNVFLRAEIDHVQAVISTVRSTMDALRRAANGETPLTESLASVASCLQNGRSPPSWTRISWSDDGSIGSWLNALNERAQQLRTWCFEGRPKTFWIGGFCHVRAFVTAVMQEVTRNHKDWVIEDARATCSVMREFKNDVITGPSEGVYVHGMYLENAQWDRRGGKLVEAKSRVPFSELPVMHLYAVAPSKTPAGAGDQQQSTPTFRCPVYTNKSRTDDSFVTALDLRTTAAPDHWLLRGVALLCRV